MGITNENSNTLKDYLDTILVQLSASSITTIYVLPEYCWGDITYEELLESIKKIEENLQESHYFVYGTFPTEIRGQKKNIAHFGDKDGIIKQIPKTRILEDEKKRNKVVSGENPGIIKLKQLRVAIIICADIWDNILLNNLLKLKEADILICPAFTVVPPNHNNYAKIQWQSLAIVRSREYLVPIAIADHTTEPNKLEYTTGSVTCIVNPSLKSENMQIVEDFLELPTNQISKLIIDIEEVRKYKKYRLRKGLYQKKSSNES